MRRSRTRSPRRPNPLLRPPPRRQPRSSLPSRRRRAAAASATTVTVIVENVEIARRQRERRGLRQGPEPRGLPLQVREVPAAAGFVETSSTDIPPGTYAVVGYHDVNGNDEFDKFLGMPREPYALSSKAGDKLVPTFADAALTIKSGENAVIIRLKTLRRRLTNQRQAASAARVFRRWRRALRSGRGIQSPTRCNITATHRELLALGACCPTRPCRSPHGIASATSEAGIGRGRLCCRDTVENRLQVVLAQPRGFCAGVVRAIDIVELALAEIRPADLRPPRDRAQPPCRRQPDRQGRALRRGAERSAGRRDHHLQRARRVARRGRTRRASRGLPTLDATCPLVSKVHNQGRHYIARGRTLILIGHAGHPEVEGTLGQIDGADLSRAERGGDRGAAARRRHAGRLHHADDAQRRRHERADRGAEAAFHRRRRPGDARHLLRHAEPAERRARPRPRGRSDPRRRREKQLQFQPLAGDCRGIRRAGLSCRRRQPGGPRHGSNGVKVVGLDGGRVGARSAGGRRHRRAAAGSRRWRCPTLDGIEENVRFRLPLELEDNDNAARQSGQQEEVASGYSVKTGRQDRQLHRPPASRRAASAIRWC